MTEGVTREARLGMPPEHEALVAAMVDAVRALAALPHDPSLLRNLIDQALWDVTQFREGPSHKCGGLRWRTRAAHAIAHPPWKDLRHEHVIERDWLIRLLRATPEAAPSVLWNMPVALVTKKEAEELPHRISWHGRWCWERYLTKPLVVLDVVTGEPLDLARMNQALRSHYAPLVERATAAGAVL